MNRVKTRQISILPKKEWRYRQDVLSSLLKWSLAIVLFVTFVYFLALLKNPEWVTTVLLVAFSLFLPISCWCLHLLRTNRRHLAGWIYLINAMVLTALFMLFMPESFLLIGMIGFMLFVRVAAFMESFRTTLKLMSICIFLYLAILALRNIARIPEVNIDAIGNLVLYSLPVAVLILFSTFDRISTRYLKKSLVQSEKARRNLAQSNKKLKRQKVSLEKSKLNLTKLTTELKSSNKELEDFAYVASHDLKEPLRGIKNYSNFLLEDYASQLDEEGKEKLKTLAYLARRMENLISSLLNYSRVGRTKLSIKKTDLNEVITDVLNALQVTIQENKVDVRIPKPLPIIECDRIRVREIFHNLVTNAIKYNDKPQKWVEIGYQITKCKNGLGKIVFSVYDNGIGIKEKHQDRIFQIFKRLHSRDKFGAGTGAGLTIAKKIVERHGGQLWVASTFRVGTCFYFTLNGEHFNIATESIDFDS